MKRATVRSVGMVALVLAGLVGVGSTAQAETSRASGPC